LYSGSATSYSNSMPLTSDGKWSVQPAVSAAYQSRLVVIRPSNPAHFSGTVIVEWLNDTAGFDNAPDWIYGHDQILRSGDAFVGVSAQAVGVNYLKSKDPGRYSGLLHPGDSFSYDIFSQAGMAVRDRASMLLPGMRPRVIVADGESQSAIRMVTYVDAVAPLVNVFDGYLIHSRGSSGAPLSQAPQPAIPTPSVVGIRGDFHTPVLTFETETDVVGGVLGPIGYFPATQPDSRSFRLWEVAGTSHIDGYNTSGIAQYDDGNWAADLQLFALMSSPPTTIPEAQALGLNISCGGTGFNAGEEHYVFDTAFRDIASWAQAGVPPRHMPRFAINTSVTPPTYQLDRNGNVVGGIRTPAVDAPLAVVSGQPAPNSPGFCNVFGQTHPFSALQIVSLYSSYHNFALHWQRAVHNALLRGALVPEDAQRLSVIVREG
jgi:hypothetical protein